MTVNVEF